MQDPKQDTVEITILRNRRDLRGTTRTVYGREIRWVGIGGMVAALVAGIAFCAEQLVVAAILLLGVVVAWTYHWWRIELIVWRFPDWAYEPVTFRVSAQGVEIETVVSRRRVLWKDMTEVLVAPDAYFFGSPNRKGIILHRRCLAESDTAAINSVIERRGKDVEGRVWPVRLD
ncbi:hypothetical protein ACN263_07555 [Micromonospora sp. WMMD729]|uniref:hypothetical protein n=1 Tax=Micromonospora sp. WMMD729 TaxID=3404127 RepID=UPI003BF46CD8